MFIFKEFYLLLSPLLTRLNTQSSINITGEYLTIKF